MSEELLELVQAHVSCDKTGIQNTYANANLVSTHITNSIVENLEDKAKLRTCINFLRNLGRHHNRKRCVDVDNISVFLKHLPIASKRFSDEDLYLPVVDIKAENNAFYAEKASRRCAIAKRKALVNTYTQCSLPCNFDFVLMSIPETQSFQFLEVGDNKLAEDSNNYAQRETDVRFTTALMNLQVDTTQIINNVVAKLSTYETLLASEKQLLALVLHQGKLPVDHIIEQFPFLLEETLIDIAIKHLRGNPEEGKDLEDTQWIRNNAMIRHQAAKIAQALFAMAKYDLKLLDALTRIIR